MAERPFRHCQMTKHAAGRDEKHFFWRYSTKKIRLIIAQTKNVPTFATAIEKRWQPRNGALVQLVRIRACHARGHGFESRTHRSKSRNGNVSGFCFYQPAHPRPWLKPEACGIRPKEQKHTTPRHTAYYPEGNMVVCHGDGI